MMLVWILRSLALVLIVFLAAKPVMVRPPVGISSIWAVLIDSSGSMRVKDPSPRIESAIDIAENLTKKLPSVRLYQFSSDIEEISSESIDKIKPTGKKSNIALALQKVFSERDWRGAVVLTDGRQVGIGDVISVAASAGKPLVLVGMGDQSLYKDIAVRSIHAPPFAFKNLSLSLSATVSIIGYAGKKINVRLLEGQKVLSIQTTHAATDNVDTVVNFQWTPETLGSKRLTVEVGQYEGEITHLNNKKNVTLDVGRDRFRVLYICGEPGPEYGFLRHQFKSDPAVELVTFVILRNSQNILTVPENELSLIPFPTQDVLISQMETFDLVVFEEFSYSQYGLLPAVVGAIRKKVLDGGSFLLVGGPVVFGPGSGYSLPSLSDMIPVPVGSPTVKRISEPLPFVIRAPSHPILRLEPNPDLNKEIWKNLPLLDDVTLVPPAKSGATVLGVVNVEGKEHPVLTVWQFGKGRVAALSSRTTWRWSMLKGKREQSADAYQQFWKNMVLWLTHSDRYKPVRMAVEKSEIPRGQPEPLRVWVYDEYFKPISDVDVRIQLTLPDGKTETLMPYLETSGVFSVTLKNDKLGDHLAETWVMRRGKRIGNETLKIRVIEGHSEEEDLRPDFDMLKELARTTNGRFLRGGEFSPKLMQEFDNQISEKAGRKVLIWTSPWILALLIGVLMSEWIIRKRKGLP